MREYLRRLREINRISMQSAANHIGISRQYYQQIEAGERQKKIDITLVTALASLFNVSVEEIISQETKITNSKMEEI